MEYPRSSHRPGVSRLTAAYPEGRSTTGIVALRGSKPPHSCEWFLHGPHVPATDAALGDRLTLWTTAGYPGDWRNESGRNQNGRIFERRVTNRHKNVMDKFDEI